MSKKFKVWLDSGANHVSRREQEVTLDEFNISDAEWDSMTEEQREDVMRDVAWDRMDWGYAEVKV